MPTTALQRSPPRIKPQFTTDFDTKDSEVKGEVKRTFSTVNTAVDEDGAGETVSKKPVKKPTKPDESAKKISATTSDKVPKKTAQRARGATALNRTVGKASSDGLDKTKAASGDKVPAPKEECVEKLPKKEVEKGKAENRKPAETPEKKSKIIPRKPGSKATKRPPKVPTPVPSQMIAETLIAEVPIIETPAAEVKTAEEPIPENIVKEIEEPQATTTNSLGHGLSCSFFERLQLGVKAYFTNRNSFTCSDKNKKEGGNQTRARLGKGVKEDARKTDPGFKFKNNIYISESDSLFDQLRLNSNTGGESSNFLTNTPKISQNIKRKKLKHCVRIQIPRKGYFYRSSMQSKIPGQPPASPLELLEPSFVPKNKSKIQIFGLAPAGSEITRVPWQKRMKKTLKYFSEADTGLLHSDEESIDGSFSEISNWSSSSKLLAERCFDDDRHRPAEICRSGKNVSSVDLFPEFGERERERHFILENSFNADGQKKKRTAAGVGGDFFENLEPGRRTPTTLETLTSCINSVLGKDELIQNLEITPVDIDSDKDFQSISEEIKKPLITPVSIDRICSKSTFQKGINPTAVLMEEIDLHLELQNYIKAFNNVGASKVRTKNTLHSNEPSKSEFEAEELFERREKRRDLKSVRNDASYNFLDEVEEERIESRLARSQTQLSNILKQMQRANPMEKEFNRTFLTEKLIDSYEKIFPLGSQQSYTQYTLYSSEGSASWHSSTKTLPESHGNVEKYDEPLILSLNLQDMVEVYENILEEYEKLKRRGRKSLQTSLSFHLISFLSEKLTGKKSKKNLIQLSKEMSSRQGWKHSTKRMESINVQEYVIVFQKLLKSTMPIKQITHLNSIIAGWESRSEEWMKYIMKNLEKARVPAKQAKKLRGVATKAKSQEAFSKSEDTTKTPLTIQKPKEQSLPSSRNFQLMLESFFNSKGEDFSGLSSLKGKVLVDVKLAGSQIQVNDLSFLSNKIPPRKTPDTNETSELIIESVGKSDLSDLFNDKKLREKKKVRKRGKPKKIKMDEKNAVEKRKTPFQFNYNEFQLRTQHPIDPISELSESKILDDKVPSSDSNITNKSPLDLNLLRKALGSHCFLKDFMNKEAFGEILRKIELPFKQKLPVVLKMKPPVTVKSLVDLKTKSALWRKFNKTPSACSRSFFCYSAFESPQSNHFKGDKKGKKFEGVSSVQKNVQEFAIKQQKTGGTNLKPRETKIVSSNLHERNGYSECCSTEMLLSDKISSNKDGKQSGLTTNPVEGEEPENSVSNRKSSILFHSFNNAIDDKSFTLDLIHSDSFLKRFSHASILERDTKILFKSNSDIKFCPVRETKSKEKAKPFITFVLTPEQFEKADLLADDVLLIQRNKPSVAEPLKNVVESENTDLQDALKSIENFVEILSGSNPETKSKKSKNKTVERRFCPPSFSERKSKTRCQTCQLLYMQESQKQKKESKKVNTDSRLVVKRVKTQAKKVKSENTKPFCCRDANQNLKIYSDVSHQKIKNVISEEKKNEMKSKEATEEWENEKQNTKTEKTENFSKMSVNLENIPTELFEAIKNTINQVDGLKRKTIMSTIQEDSKKKKFERQKSGKGKIPKSFVLKIHCEKRETLKKAEEKFKSEEIPREKKETVNPLVIYESQDLEEKDSMYFDAIEKNLKDIRSGREMKSSADTFASSVPRNNPNSVPTTTNENRKSEELILNQISDSLIEGQISYSLLMLDSFLRKKEKISLKKDKITNLVKLIQIVEEDTNNIMTNLERTAWQKVLNFLDSLSQIIDESVEEELKTHLQATKTLVRNILKLNVSRIDELDKFNISVTQIVSGNDSDSFGAIKQCLTYFGRKLGLANGKTGENESNSRDYAEELMIHNSKESVLSEFRELKNKLVEELKLVEKLFLVSELSRSSSSFEENSSGVNGFEDGRTQSDDWLIRAYDCMHLMQCLIKVWDTRMSLITYPNDCSH